MNEGIKIAILDMYNGHTNEGMRCIKTITGRFLAQENIEGNYDIFDVRQKNELPDLSYDIYISSGGPGNPAPQGDVWETPFYALLDGIWNYNLKPENEQKKYLFLVCHSFQVAADHWGLGKVCKRRTTSFGIFPMHRTLIGHDEVLFQNLPELFYAVDSRDYQLIEPNLNQLDKWGQIFCVLKKIDRILHSNEPSWPFGFRNRFLVHNSTQKPMRRVCCGILPKLKNVTILLKTMVRKNTMTWCVHCEIQKKL